MKSSSDVSQVLKNCTVGKALNQKKGIFEAKARTVARS